MVWPRSRASSQFNGSDSSVSSATGNIPTEDLIYMLHRCGYRTGVSLEAAIEASGWLQEQLGRPVPGMLVKAGAFPRARGAQA